MELDEVIEKRRTVRNFIDEAVPDQDIRLIIGAASLAPSAGNLQSFHISAVTEPGLRKKIAIAANDQDFVAKAGLCLVFFADPDASAREYGNRGKDLYCIQDATISAVFAILKAVDLGYSTAWIGSFNDKRIAELLQYEKLKPVAIVLVGRGAETPAPRMERNPERLVRYYR